MQNTTHCKSSYRFKHIAVLSAASALFCISLNLHAELTECQALFLINCPSISTSSGASSVRTSNVYAGLKWTWGQTNASDPDLVIGVRRSTVNSDGQVNGGDLSLSFKGFTGPSFSKLRFKYFNGKEVNQSELSFGYDKQKGAFGGFGFKAPHANAGLDFFDFSLDEKARETYFIVDTLKRSYKPNGSGAWVCPDGTVPSDTSSPITRTTLCNGA